MLVTLTRAVGNRIPAAGSLASVRQTQQCIPALYHRLFQQPSQYLSQATYEEKFSSSSSAASPVTDDVMSGPDFADVVVVGGGTAGAALASALAASPMTSELRVVVVEQNKIAEEPMNNWHNIFGSKPPHIACSTLSNASIEFLDLVGAWDDVVATGRPGPFSDMTVWDGIGPGRITFSAPAAGVGDILGQVVENPLVVSSLHQVLRDADNVSIKDGVSLSAIHNHTNASSASDEASLHSDRYTTLQLSDGSELHTRLVIGADGANSRVAELLDLKGYGWSYRQSGVIATIECDPFHTAFQRFLPTGPVAILPVYGPSPDSPDVETNYLSLVWTTSTSEAQRLCALDKDEFLRELHSALHAPSPAQDPLTSLAGAAIRMLPFSHGATPPTHEIESRLPQMYRVTSDIAARPLALKHRPTYTTTRAAVLGDAAHVVHPLAGQGANIGLADAMLLASTIARAVGSGTDIGSPIVLNHYTRERLVHNSLMLGLTDTLKRLFSTSASPVAALRSVGLSAIDQLPPAKRLLTNYAMGTHLQPLFQDLQRPLDTSSFTSSG